jgi:ribulose-bisphosphate carboxylase large chain
VVSCGHIRASRFTKTAYAFCQKWAVCQITEISWGYAPIIRSFIGSRRESHDLKTGEKGHIMELYRESVEKSDYITARYYLKSKTSLWDAAYNIAIGQSIGNPKIRNSWETDALYHDHSCKIVSPLGKEELLSLREGEICIAFPKRNINFKEDGVTQLLCFLMGGHLDIDIIECCQLIDVDLDTLDSFSPKYGISGFRDYLGVHDRPFLGAIIKPKTGLSPIQLLEVVKQLVDGGVDFIKEDEILGNPDCCPLTDRIKTLQPYLNGKKVIYCYCINGDYPYCIERAKAVAAGGGNGVHLNIWGGLGIYKSVRELDLPLFIHFQKSGDRAFTSRNHAHHIRWPVVCKLAAIMGVDSIHAGMWGGYSSDTTQELTDSLNVLRSKNVVPALSCGMHPGIVNRITELFGNDYMANVGGAIHGHPQGTLAGVKAMRQAINKDFGPEYQSAINLWGLV